MKQWFVYILRCADNSLYTGVALDVNKRLDEHNGIDKNGAKYTHGRRPVKLVYQEASTSRSDAYKREYAIKCLTKSQKEHLLLKEPLIKSGSNRL
ncbi:MAG: GIY-YIG nuclease family protein [Gammaproteobacteria bacterium]|nr:GIY-YIG nuclease family protein [Gammaproteobacteria bacterium]